MQAELAAAFARLVRWNGPRPEYFARGRAAAERAIALDASSAAAWAARAALAAQQGTAEAALASAWARRALSLDPAASDAHRAVALSHLRAGRPGDAEAALRRIEGRNPDDVDALVELAALAASARRWTEVRALANRAIAADPKAAPAYALRALAGLQNDRGLRAAFSDAETAAQLGRPVWGDAVRAQLQAAARDRDGARETVRRMFARLDAVRAPLSAWDERFVAGAVAAAGDPRVRPLRNQRRG
jgi:tetratricopeptide (TPR) repeat protein